MIPFGNKTELKRDASYPLDAEVALWFSMVLFVPGLFAPFMTLERFGLIEDTVSLARTLQLLWGNGKVLLWGVVFLFSVAVPVLKLGLEAVSCYWPDVFRDKGHLPHQLIQFLSQFSMGEIFVTAILVTTMKMDLLANVQLHAGVYFLLGSVLAGLWASWRLSEVAADE